MSVLINIVLSKYNLKKHIKKPRSTKYTNVKKSTTFQKFLFQNHRLGVCHMR